MLTQSLPLAERALRAVAARLKRIRRASGFATDAGLSVERETESASSDAAPLLIVLDAGETPESGEGNRAAMNMRLAVDVQAVLQPNCPGTDVQLLKADIKRALFEAFGGKLSDDLGAIGALSYRGAEVFNRQDGGEAALLRVSVTVSYAEGWGNPYGSQDASTGAHPIDRLF